MTQPHAHSPQHYGHGHDHAGIAPLLDLDAEVLHEALFAITNTLRAARDGQRTRRVLDLGAGTGTGTMALAERFPRADIYALDRSEQMLDLVRSKAFFRGIPERVHTVRADLDDVWPAFEPFDVAWASLSLHEVADPDRVFENILTALTPGGMLAVVEMDTRPFVLPDDLDLGTPGLEARIHAAVAPARAPMNLHPDWTDALVRAGFTDVARHRFDIATSPQALARFASGPTPGERASVLARYAHTSLLRLRDAARPGLNQEDRDTLDILLAADGPHSLLNRGDLTVNGTRSLWLARRP
ncbi:class I SAM-dependent methyltransferase [Okibacterium fritillariae]|uniref:class I SAM-dependent methyltransferase n=1 Tax=Okibacterium fritillariae TaxID=123320 RepID=UPI0040553E28